jgi:hypothetical protein
MLNLVQLMTLSTNVSVTEYIFVRWHVTHPPTRPIVLRQIASSLLGIYMNVAAQAKM